MSETEPDVAQNSEDLPSASTSSPLVFISHDARDADLAEAFSKLIKSVSAGMIKTFRSSDKSGREGFDFGEEWYKRLMNKLQSTSDVVCLFTERSLGRPWLLFEAGVAKGKLDTPVIGVALGVSLSRVSSGPFYQFQNMDDSEEDLTKLVNQLARRVSGLELDKDVVASQVAAFKEKEAELLEAMSSGGATTGEEDEESAFAKVVEEMKALPGRVADRLGDPSQASRRRRLRRFHPMMIEELAHMTGDPSVGILVAASLVREEAPWLYEIAREAYRAVKLGDAHGAQRELRRLQKVTKVLMNGPFIEQMDLAGPEQHMFMMEFPRILERSVMRALETLPLKDEGEDDEDEDAG